MPETSENVGQPETSMEPHAIHAKRFWRVGVYLLTALYATVLTIWGHSLSLSLVLVLGVAMVLAFALSGYFQVKSIGGWSGVEGYIQTHLWSSMSAIVTFCCLIIGTGIYLAVRAPHGKTEEAHNTPPPTAPAPIPQSGSAGLAPVVVAPTTTIEPVGPKTTLSPTLKLPPPRPKEGTSPSPTPTQAPSPQPTVAPSQRAQSFPNLVCTSGSACVGQNNGTVIGTQNNFGPPPPQIVGPSITTMKPIPAFQVIPNDPNRMMRASQYNSSLGFESRNKEYTVNPGLSLTFGVSSAFTDPDFQVGCDHPCTITGISTSQADGNNTNSMAGLPSVLNHRESVTIKIRSLDAANPVTKADVQPNLK
jgi:hypothetical protein